jgi:ribosomal protein S18 acetylase RimI-like enzyme
VERALSEAASGSLRFRHPVEADHRLIVDLVDEWWGGQRIHHLLPRLWFQHFTGTSWVAETVDGRLAGFIVGFLSPDRPGEAYVSLVAVTPNLRRQGVGRALYERFLDDVRPRGIRRVSAVAWPDNRAAVAFHRAVGFSVDAGPGTRPIHGMPAHPDYDGDRDDRVLLTRDL